MFIPFNEIEEKSISKYAWIMVSTKQEGLHKVTIKIEYNKGTCFKNKMIKNWIKIGTLPKATAELLS